MKFKNIITLLSFLAIGVATHTAYMPTNGPLVFTDTAINNGIISATVLASPALVAERATINAFAITLPNIGVQPRLYQIIVSGIRNSQTPLALEALKAYERVIMHIYRDKAYWLKLEYNPYLPVQGIRYDWFNPFSYLNPRNWIGDNNKELDQLLNELNQLADIAHGKDPLLSARMKATVHSYKHWRKYMFAIAYLFYDIGKREQNNTIIKALLNGGPKQFANQIGTNIKADVCNIKSYVSNLMFKKATAAPKIDVPANNNIVVLPPSPEDAIIHEMVRLKTIREELFNKQILAISAKEKAVAAKKLADEYEIIYQQEKQDAHKMITQIQKPKINIAAAKNVINKRANIDTDNNVINKLANIDTGNNVINKLANIDTGNVVEFMKQKSANFIRNQREIIGKNLTTALNDIQSLMS